MNLNDKNTKYFHAVAKIKTFRNRTTKLQNNQGLVIEDPQLIRQEITEELSTRYKTNRNNSNYNGSLFLLEKKITDTENLDIITKPTNKEIKDIMFSFAADKSPGPDGFPADFYIRYWSLVGDFVCNAVKSYFIQDKCLRT